MIEHLVSQGEHGPLVALVQHFAGDGESALVVGAGDFVQSRLVARGDNKPRPGLGQRRGELAAIQAGPARQHHHLVFQTELFEDVHTQAQTRAGTTKGFR